jgi:hypothetical protein
MTDRARHSSSSRIDIQPLASPENRATIALVVTVPIDAVVRAAHSESAWLALAANVGDSVLLSCVDRLGEHITPSRAQETP